MKFPWWFGWPRHDELMHDDELGHRPPPAAHPGPKLVVRRRRPGLWCWRVCGRTGVTLDSSTAPTWAAAMAVGRAVLDEIAAAAAGPAGADHSPRQGTPADPHATV